MGSGVAEEAYKNLVLKGVDMTACERNSLACLALFGGLSNPTSGGIRTP